MGRGLGSLSRSASEYLFIVKAFNVSSLGRHNCIEHGVFCLCQLVYWAYYAFGTGDMFPSVGFIVQQDSIGHGSQQSGHSWIQEEGVTERTVKWEEG